MRINDTDLLCEQRVSPNKKPFLSSPWGWWGSMFAIYFFFVFVMLGLVPAEVALRPEAVEFADAMAKVFPMINEVQKIPGFDPFLRFYYAVFWLVLPVSIGTVSWIGASTSSGYPNAKEKMLATPYRKLIFATFFLFLLLLVPMHWPVSSSGVSWRDSGLVSGVLGVSHFGLLLVGTLALAVGCLRVLTDKVLYDIKNNAGRSSNHG